MTLYVALCSLAAVGWKRPFQHLNPTSVEIWSWNTISKPSITQHPKASRTHHSRIADDRHRCTAQSRRVNVLRDNCFGCWDEHIGLGLTSPPLKDMPHLCPCT